jgi:hypothetical protein
MKNNEFNKRERFKRLIQDTFNEYFLDPEYDEVYFKLKFAIPEIRELVLQDLGTSRFNENVFKDELIKHIKDALPGLMALMMSRFTSN